MPLEIPKRRLYIRLSSLGDIVLSMSTLASLNDDEQADWLVAKEFSGILEGHPKIGSVIPFDRRSGESWSSICKLVRASGYDEIHDLHGSIRTLLLKVYLSIFSNKKMVWRSVSKQRLRRAGFFIFKRFWPKFARPTHWLSRFQSDKHLGCLPSLDHLLDSSQIPILEENYGVVMPSSAWVGKEWPTSNLQLLMHRETLKGTVKTWVVVGTQSDESSKKLFSEASSVGLNVVDRVGKLDIRGLAQLLKGAKRYLGVDTGISHIAQALGVPSIITFGPSSPDCGFGPWDRERMSLGGTSAWVKGLECAPCSKDGKTCLRFFDRHACMKGPQPWIEFQASRMATLRLKIYSSFAQFWIDRIRGRANSSEWIFPQNPQKKSEDKREKNEERERGPRVWIHAASVGELEGLSPVIEALIQRGVSRNNLLVTAFSPSADKSLEKLGNLLGVAVSRSPGEGQWFAAISNWKPDEFITMKYEAWPALWAALSAFKVRLTVVSAQARSSIRVARWGCRLLGYSEPITRFITPTHETERELKGLYEECHWVLSIDQLGEPRWDRVHQRIQAAKSVQATKATQVASKLGVSGSETKFNVGVLGSIWKSDWIHWVTVLKSVVLNQASQVRHKIFVVPHKIDEEFISQMVSDLKSIGVNPLRSSANGMMNHAGEAGSHAPLEVCIVDEMGVLTELYSFGHWAYVGGGFGRGVHSTIEPSMAGIPVACGKSHWRDFSEIVWLKENGILTLVDSPDEIAHWLQSVGHPLDRKVIVEKVQSQMGAAAKITGVILTHWEREGRSLALE